ncbi:DDE_3 domain-containing protein [Trichonephila clavipes]|nr:DDE_3 domain-containing protein [Trichonephila clavipes]
MDDNARPHRDRIVEEYLEDHGLERMEWPARSPDLNPIEHLWGYLGREVAALNPPPRSLHELKQGLLCVWSSLPIPVSDNLINSMEIDAANAFKSGEILILAFNLHILPYFIENATPETNLLMRHGFFPIYGLNRSRMANTLNPRSDTMACAVLADPTRFLQGTNRVSGLAMEVSQNDLGSLEKLLLYADEYYLAGKLPLGDYLGNVLHGVEEYRQLKLAL